MLFCCVFGKNLFSDDENYYFGNPTQWLVEYARMSSDLFSWLLLHPFSRKRKKTIPFSALIGVTSSVTSLGDLWDFGHVLKPLATINLPRSPTFLGNFCKGVKIYSFQVKSFWATFIDIWQYFSGHTGHKLLLYSIYCLEFTTFEPLKLMAIIRWNSF